MAIVIDIAARRVLGRAIADHVRTDVVADAPPCHRAPPPIPEVDLPLRPGVRLSVGREGQCRDNAAGESFFTAIKTELLEDDVWLTHAAKTAIIEYIEGW